MDHSRSFEITLFENFATVSYLHFQATMRYALCNATMHFLENMAASLVVCEIVSVK